MKKSKKFLYRYSLICLMITIIISVFSILFYRNSHKILTESVNSRLKSNLQTAALYVDIDEHARIREEYKDRGFAGDKSSLEDIGLKSMKTQLQNYAKNIDATYIYTINLNEATSEFYFILDTDSESFTYVGETYEGLGKKEVSFFTKALNTPGEFFISEVKDSTGSYMTGCTALVKEGQVGVEALLCIDLPLSYLESHRNTFLITICFLEGSLILTFLIVGWFLVKLLRKNVEMQEKIEFMAYYDSLTTLPNRAALLEKLGEMMQALTKNPKYSIALFFIDVDNFKKVNDSEGHITGDILLQDIAKFLKSHSNLRPLVNNKEFVARLGGDEFVMLYPIKSTEEIHKFAQLLIDDFKKLKANNHVMTDFKVSLSIGAATYPQDAHDTSSLLKAADQAMYEVKRGGKQNYSIYGEDKEK